MKSMLKQVGLSCALVLALVVAVVLLRAARLKPPVITAAPAMAVPLDRLGALQRLRGAIRIPTESLSQQPPDQVALWQLRHYLEQSFPRVHATLHREVLSAGALLFTWRGRRPEQPPVVLMGHLDVVTAPAETFGQWIHAPYSGDIADGFIWGRGTLDDKVHVLSLLEAAETLLSRGFTPARTILLAFGSDEENGGQQGARQIVKLLHERQVRPDFVLDEGGIIVRGLVPGIRQPIALIGTAEKGYLDVVLTTQGRGGHSSEPPSQTAIGELSAALVRLENHPFPAALPEAVREQLQIFAPYLPFSRRVLLANLWLFQPLVLQAALKNPAMAATVHTTTAETMFHAGFKSNVLPTQARAVVNFRLLPGETVHSVLEHVRQVVADRAVTITNDDPAHTRPPSPISPLGSEGYRLLQTTLHQTFPDAIVTPNLLSAGTDAYYYTSLTPNVYRFLALEVDPSVLTMIHGINERIACEGYLKTVQYTAQLMQNIQ